MGKYHTGKYGATMEMETQFPWKSSIAFWQQPAKPVKKVPKITFPFQ